MVLASFLCFLLLFTAVGLLSARRSRGTNEDYLLAGRSVSPWLVALSAVATNNSGYMFVGQIGYTYLEGLSSIWLMVGWIGGDLLASWWVHRRVAEVAERRRVLSFGGLLSDWWGDDHRWVRRLTGLTTLVFLGIYAAAQLKAGSKALHVLFGWEPAVGAVVGCGIVLVYCMAGGIRASIWTDAAQSLVMVVAMAMLLFAAVSDAGGLGGFLTAAEAVSPSYMSWTPSGTSGVVGVGLFIAGWAFAGLGVVGQPHIMVRFMTLEDPEKMGRVRFYYYLWFVFFYLCSIGVGLAARVGLPEVAAFDAELALPVLSQELLHPALVGVILAGLFSATMSTADSQILSCSAAVTRDVLPQQYDRMWVSKVATVSVALLALVIALTGSSNVFGLVVLAWSVLAAAFGPLLFTYAAGGRPIELVSVVMLVVGASVAVGWKLFGYSGIVTEVAPGMVAGFSVYFVGRWMGFDAGSRELEEEMGAPL